MVVCNLDLGGLCAVVDSIPRLKLMKLEETEVGDWPVVAKVIRV